MTPVLNVRFYTGGHGREPVREWLRSLPHEARRLLGEDIKTVQWGWPLGMPLVRKMEPGLWEIRSRLPDGVARVFFTVVGSDIVLLHGFVKKAQRTPRDELKTAQQRKNEVHA